MVQRRRRTPQNHGTGRWLRCLLLLLWGGLLGAGTLGAQAQPEPAQLPPEVREWARQTVEQLSVAIRETILGLPASDLSELQLRATRVLNVLVGRQATEYQTRVGDPPGADGVGVLVYLERIKGALESQVPAHEQRLRPLLFAVNMLRFYNREAVERLVRDVLRARDAETARRALNQSLAFLIAIRGSSEDPLSEGGGARALLLLLSRP